MTTRTYDIAKELILRHGIDENVTTQSGFWTYRSMTKAEKVYKYKAIVDSVDSRCLIHLNVDLGFRIWHSDLRVRLHSVTIHNVVGTMQLLQELLPDGTHVVLESHRSESYTLGFIWRHIGEDRWHCVNEIVAKSAYASSHTRGREP